LRIGLAVPGDELCVDLHSEGVADFTELRVRLQEVDAGRVATMHNRRAALRAFYRTARRLRLTLDDPTTDIDVPARQSSARRPLSDDEAALVRLFSEHAAPTRHAATAALLLAGAHTCELGHITATDVGPHAATVRAPGSNKHRPRTLSLDAWSVRVLTERIAYLTDPLPAAARPPVLCTGAVGSNAHKQASACVTVRDILTRAGLTDDHGVRPTSLTAYAARREYERTGRIEDAARRIGSASLDATAVLIDYHWHDEGRSP
jgi:integrase/recombinase XerC